MVIKLDIDRQRISAVNIEKVINYRKTKPTKEQDILIKNRSLVEKLLNTLKGKESSPEEITAHIKWLEKVSKYIPISSEKELEEIIRYMILLSKERAKYNELYDYPGLDLMKRVRETMIRYMVVLSELRARRKEYLEYWFTDEYWITELSRILFDTEPTKPLKKYGFEKVPAGDFLLLLLLELATADDTSKLDKPMVRLQAIKGKEATFIVIPTEAAALEYQPQIDQILNNQITFTIWVKDTLRAFKLP
ncbi:MAG: hypothetical protein EAX86_07625 [Candidatus Heimdallarchaeota archaeon]|nr:hypothetical protein [Candidatus Heimdallarchaeota archaeon]